MTKRSHRLLAAAGCASVLALLTVLLLARPASAQCSYTGLVGGNTVTTSTTPQYFTINQAVRYWTAIAVRSSGSDDWDISSWQTTAGYPACVGTMLASSARGAGVDFVIGDFNYYPTGTYYIEANRFNGSGNAQVEWNATNGVMGVNAPLTNVTTDASDIIHIWDVQLTAGQTYTFWWTPSGAADLRLMLFRDPDGATPWVYRNACEFEVTTGNPTYTAPSSGWYGVVVLNDNGQAGSYTLGVGACTAPQALASGVPTAAYQAENYYSFNQSSACWMAIGVRGESDWDMHVYGSGSGGSPPVCLGNELGYSQLYPPTVDFMVGDFNFNPTGTYYARAHLYGDQGVVPGTVLWSNLATTLVPNGPVVYGALDASHILDVWEVALHAHTDYVIHFHSDVSGIRYLLFQNAGAGSYWAPRAAAVLTGTGEKGYRPPADGVYGLVVVNDGGASGSYELEVGHCAGFSALTANTAVTTGLAVASYSFNQPLPYWTAVGVRGDNLETQWNMRTYSAYGGTTYPYCGYGSLGSSLLPPPEINFVVGDFNHMTTGTRIADVSMENLTGYGYGTVVWDPTDGLLTVNAPMTMRTYGPTDFLRIWDVRLESGTDYAFTQTPLNSSQEMLLFRNPGSGAYWAGASDAEFATNIWNHYVAPATDYYGLAVEARGGNSGTYGVGVYACTPPAALSAGVVVNTWLAENYYSFTQAAPYWTAIGVRGTSNWTIGVYGSSGGELPPICFSQGLAGSDEWRPKASLVVGDFNRNPAGTYYANAWLWAEVGSGSGAVQWDSGSDILNPGYPAVNRTVGPDDVLECWDTSLQPGHYYTFAFTHTGAADLKLLVFRNAGGGIYWVGRADAVFETPGTGTWKVPSGTAQFHGLVVVNDNGETGTYSLQVIDAGTSAVDDTPPPATGFGGIRPNPGRGGVRLEFTLHEPADVSFQVLDMAGRRVATIPAQGYGVGRATAEWDGSGPGGARVPAGIYLVRMTAGDRLIGTRRVVLLD